MARSLISIVHSFLTIAKYSLNSTLDLSHKMNICCIHCQFLPVYVQLFPNHTCNYLYSSFFHADTTNILLTIAVISVSSPVDAQLQCTFLPGFTGSTRCTVQYGNDPTYMNLPYSAESTETGTAGDTVSVVLSERLNSSTEYYYTVTAVSGDVSVTVQGTFTTPQYSKYVFAS